MTSSLIDKQLYNEEYLLELKSKIKKDRKNFLFLYWPFGNYVYEELEKSSKNINIIQLSLFKLFNVKDRIELGNLFTDFCLTYFKTLEKIINENFKNEYINGVLVTSDWQGTLRQIVSCFKYADIPVLCVVHEGVFQDRKQFYAGKKPIADYIYVWGELLKSVFIERGYDKNHIHVIGSIKLNNYKKFCPKITREEFFKKLKLDSNKKTILYCCQLCDIQWGEQGYALAQQENIIKSLIKIVEECNYNLIVRNGPAFPRTILSDSIVETIKSSNNCIVDGENANNTTTKYITEPGDSIYYSDIIVGMNTTMQLEASLLNKPAIVAGFFDFNTKWHDELGLPLCKNYNELKECILKHINSKSLIEKNRKPLMYKNYGYSEDKNYLPIRNLEEELGGIGNKSCRKI